MMIKKITSSIIMTSQKVVYNLYVALKNISILIRLTFLSLILFCVAIVFANNQNMVDLVLIKDVLEVKLSMWILIVLVAILTKLVLLIIKATVSGIFLKKKK